jgi:hypothetical protein
LQNFISSINPKAKIYLFIGAIAGGLITLAVLQRFSPTQAALLSAIILSLLSLLSTQITHPVFWWTGTGAIGGIIVGLADVLEKTLADTRTELKFSDRLAILALQGIAGFVSGVILGRKSDNAQVPTLREFLSRSSALTTGMFAIVVTVSFVREGLEVARTLSSRLSATTTILVTALVVPGIVGYLLFDPKPSIPLKKPER